VQDHIYRALLFRADDVKVVAKGAIPKTTSGKVRRQECKAQYLRGELGLQRSRRWSTVLTLTSSGIAYARALLARWRQATLNTGES
jgi:hypothetical protein